ncbi:hypothetical protein [Geomonas subterranea]|uniref:hypothetical protein n=1 Tax=Geomonas subterranea TaxID=2847989 RepID=UPI001CD244D4|nr:hypothetical protein [Geomonas fuzhouensis]
MIRILTAVLVIAWAGTASAKNLGVVGKTYPFAERDALAEIEERAKQVDWNKHLAKLKTDVARYKPELPDLPRVIADRVRRIDSTYTLDVDVPDPRDPSRVLYPKGFSFNPFQYFTLPGCIVFVDVGDKKQLAWLKKSSFAADASATILLTGGEAAKAEEMFSRPFTYASSSIVDRLNILAVPSAACQKGVEVEVHEYLP